MTIGFPPLWLFLLVLLIFPPMAFPETVRPPILAGTWYKGNKKDLIREVDGFLEKARISKESASPIALVSPHAGYAYSGQTAAYGYQAVKGRDVRRVIVLAPTHRIPFQGVSVANVDFFETPLGRIRVDQKACQSLLASPHFSALYEAHRQEHSLEIQLPFLQRVFGEWSLVPLITGELQKEEYRKVASEILKVMDSKTLLVASSDFTHYGPRFGYVPFKERIPENLQKLDQGAIDRILAKDFEGFLDYCDRTGITICGFRPIGVLLNLLPPGSTGRLLHYDTSGRITNDYEHSVSYASILFSKP